MIEGAHVRRDPIVIALAILANVIGIFCLTIAIANDPLIFGLYGVLRLTASYGLLRMKTYGLILETVSALLGIAVPVFFVLLAVLILHRPFGALEAFGVLIAIFSSCEIWYLGRSDVKARFVKRGQPGVRFPKALWFAGQLVLLCCFHVALPLIPIGFGARDEAAQRRTMADMRAISLAIESRAIDVNDYPFATSIEAIAPKISPTYMKQVPLRDGWGNRWRYGAWKVDPKTPGRDAYVIVSPGKDGRFELVDPKYYKPKNSCPGGCAGETTNFDCDIVFSNGAFIQFPAGRSGS
jgi:hypothetical protein